MAGRAVVIAGGFSPGLPGLEAGLFKDFAIGAQAEVEAPRLEEVEVYFGEMAPGFFAWLVPVTPPLVRAGLISRENPGDYLKKWLSELAIQGKIASVGARINYGGIPLRSRGRSYGERMLVVGDAAGQVKPISGGGIYYGLISADIAAAVLHQALGDGDLSAKRLARYERGWRKRLGQELRTGYRFRRLFERLSDRQIDRLFGIVEGGGIDAALLKAGDISFDWHASTIIRLLKYQVVAATIGHIKMPFNSV
jgi:digeranylgeranylglycerophospholipid reductase